MNSTIEKILNSIVFGGLNYKLENGQLVVTSCEICGDLEYRFYERNVEPTYIDDKIIYIEDEIKYIIAEDVLTVEGINSRKAKAYLNKMLKYIGERDEYTHELIMNNID